jgi:hypothetical protein
VLTVTFDRPLQPGALAHSNWRMRWADGGYAATSAVATGSKVTCAMLPTPPDPGPNVCCYDASPRDVVSIGGSYANAFSDFPVAAAKTGP